MARKTKVKKSEKKLSAIHEELIVGLIGQFDALVNGLCDACCISNYWKTQRDDLLKRMREMTVTEMQVAGIRIEYEIAGSDYPDNDPTLLGDTVILTPYYPYHGGMGRDEFEDDQDVTYLQWDGHLRPDLRGYVQSTTKGK